MKPIHTITEGGQLALHSMRMLKQVFKISIFVSSVSWLALFFYSMSRIPTYLYQNLWYYLVAVYSKTIHLKSMMINRDFWWKVSGNSLRDSENVLPDNVLQFVTPHLENLIEIGKANVKISTLVSIVVFSLTTLFFFLRGKISSKKQHVAGNTLSSAWKVAFQLRFFRQASKISIGSVPLVKGTETQHILITGGTGSGKTNCFYHLLPQIRKCKHRAIIIDTTGAYVERYYRPNQDLILNPFDSRGLPWHPWVECQDIFDYEALAESFIPLTYLESEKYWNTAARSLLSSLLIKLQGDQKISELNQWMLYNSLSKLTAFVSGTKAASHIDMNSEKTASSIRSVAASHLGSLEFLKDTTNPFSIRKWIESEKNDSWLFLAAKPSQRSALNPLLSCWFSVAMRSMLHLNPDLKRRIWFIIDELPSLHRLKDLELFLSESRKYGGCALLAIQSPAQLEAIYGSEITRIILGNCSTKITFSEQDPEIAARISKAFGEREVREYQKGLSYGANDVRDGVNLTLQTRQQPLIPATSIQFLEKNESFVRLPGNHPIVKIKLKIMKS